ncbi:MAG TPA: hypothetical protein VK141_03120 [Nitrosomonas sp.]|nr:hypothetical protein [Nitrosomonas sp.]
MKKNGGETVEAMVEMRKEVEQRLMNENISKEEKEILELTIAYIDARLKKWVLKKTSRKS